MLQVQTYPPYTACCTCATLLSNVVGYPPHAVDWSEKDAYIYSEKDEKRAESIQTHLQTECCGRYTCSVCIENNPRFATYCPFCPSTFATSSKPNVANLPLPPTYDASQIPLEPPPYTAEITPTPAAGSITHHLQPADSLPILSLRYTTPLPVLRAHNRIFSDHLIGGRSHILIPRAYYSGPSLSPDPVQSEEDNLLKRFQVRTKCVEYDVAKVYLEDAEWDLEKAVVRWDEDERWEQSTMSGRKGKERKGSGTTPGMTMRKVGLFR